MRKFALVATFVAGTIAGVLVAFVMRRPASLESADLARAVVPLGERPCLPATAEEQRMYYAALDVLELADQVETDVFAIGAERMLGQGIYRDAGDASGRVCAPADLYARATFSRGS